MMAANLRAEAVGFPSGVAARSGRSLRPVTAHRAISRSIVDAGSRVEKLDWGHWC